MVLYLINFIKGSLQDEADQLFQAILKLDVARRIVTRSAVCQARRKIKYTVFIALLDIICHFLNRKAPMDTYKGYRVMAIDGSTLRLPDNEPVRRHFGVSKYHKDKFRAIGRLSIMHDVLNRITYDATLTNYLEHEHSLAWEHMENAALPPGSLILLDRGYNSYHLLNRILEDGHQFCIRAKTSLKIVKSFLALGQAEGIFQYRPPKADRNNTRYRSFKVRLIRFQQKNETFVLMTSLLDTKEHARSELYHLYHQRWQVEESYKVKKCRLCVEEFSCQSPEFILQDFHAKVFAECLTSALTLGVRNKLEEYCLNTIDEYRVSLTQAVSKMKNTIALLFIRSKPAKLLSEIHKLFLKSLVALVPGRFYERKGEGRSGAKLQKPSMGYRRNR